MPGGNRKAPRTQSVTPALTQTESNSKFTAPTGATLSEFTKFNVDINVDKANMLQGFDDLSQASKASTAAQSKGLGIQRKFGLAGFALDREQLAINQRDAREGAINNALQRGIFRSGVRIQAENRVAEQGDLSSRRLGLNEAELKARIANSLDALRAGAAQSAATLEQDRRNAEAQFEQDALVALAEFNAAAGGAYVAPTSGRGGSSVQS